MYSFIDVTPRKICLVLSMCKVLPTTFIICTNSMSNLILVNTLYVKKLSFKDKKMSQGHGTKIW